MKNAFKYLQYLQFLPLLASTIDFIKQAEATYKGQGTGPEKLVAVVHQFVPLVEQYEVAGLVPAKLGEELVSNSSAIVSLIVQFMNMTGGVQPAAPEQPQQPASSFPYGQLLSVEPNDADLQNGDEIYDSQSDTAPHWFVRAHGVGAQPIPAGFVLLRTVTK